MNLECEETASSIVYKNNPRVSVIRWIGREPTKLCQDEPSFDEDCTSSFVEEELFGSRIVSNSSTNTFKYCCSLCEKTFKCLSHWKSHERTHTGQILFECETCGKSFTRPDDLQCHRFTHLNRNPLSTSGEIISYVQKNVEKHISRPNTSSGLISTVTSELVGTVGNTKLFNCDRCSRKFFSTAGLVEHIQFHKGKKIFICLVCDMVFPKKSALDIHSRVHTGIKPYPCNICGKAFSTYGNLKRHLLIHTGERPYICLHCSKDFNNPSHLTRHLKNKHPKETEIEKTVQKFSTQTKKS